MKGYNLWSYAPYKPLLRNVGDIYVCRIVPYENSIYFEWISEDKDYSVFCRKVGCENYNFCGKTNDNFFKIKGLSADNDYEFYVNSGEKNSLIRIARTGKSVGTVVNYLHPNDNAYSFSGKYLCSPSLVRHPDGYLLASMDVYEHDYPQNLTLIFRSDDNGESWHYVSELMPCFWGKLFIHKNELYMLACSTEYGDLLISKSNDGGKTFLPPVCILRGSNGKNGTEGVHRSPQNLLIHNGRIYTSLEWGSWANKEFCHAAMVMSCSVDDDLLTPENWVFSYPKKFEPTAPEIANLPHTTQTIEGTVALAPNGKLYNVMRFGAHKKLIAYLINTENLDAMLEYSHCISLPISLSKFMIKYDDISKKYYTIASRLHDTKNTNRNLLSLFASKDMENWYIVSDLIDFSDDDPQKIGFQYVDFDFDSDDIIYLSRTAINNANSFHDSNYSTFHRIKNFRSL